MAIFFHQKFVIFSIITDSFLVEKWGTLEHARRYVCKNVLSFDWQDSICFTFFKLFKNQESFGKSFSFSFSARFDRNFRCFLCCTMPFLNIMKFEDSRHIKRYIFYDFFSMTYILEVCS